MNNEPNQWRPQNFISGEGVGERNWHLKAITRPPAGGPGAKAAPDGRKWIHFLNVRVSSFFLPKNQFFSEKSRKIEHILQEFLDFFERLFFPFIFYDTL